MRQKNMRLKDDKEIAIEKLIMVGLVVVKNLRRNEEGWGLHGLLRELMSAGADNILNKKWRGGYVGMGVRFEDEDFKYLFGTLPKISIN